MRVYMRPRLAANSAAHKSDQFTGARIIRRGILSVSLAPSTLCSPHTGTHRLRSRSERYFRRGIKSHSCIRRSPRANLYESKTLLIIRRRANSMISHADSEFENRQATKVIGEKSAYVTRRGARTDSLAKNHYSFEISSSFRLKALYSMAG